MKLELSQEQLNNLATPVVSMVDSIAEFFQHPQNEKAYQEWYRTKYGYYPNEVKNETQNKNRIV